MGFVGLEELHQFCGIEEVEEVVDEFEVVSVVFVDQSPELFDVVFAGLSLAEPADVHEDVDGLLDLQIDHADVHWLVVVLLLLEGRSVAVHLFIIALFVHPVLSLLFLVLLVFFVVFLMEILALDVAGQFFVIFLILLLSLFFLSFHVEIIVYFLFLSLFKDRLLLFRLLWRDFLPLLLELILAGLPSFHLHLFLFVFEGEGGEGIVCAFCFVDDLKELLAWRLWRFGLFGGFGSGLCDLLVF